MKITYSTQCPLCEAPAKFQNYDHNDKKHVLCSNCHEFIISKSAERKLNAETAQEKSAISRLAALAPEGTILVVKRPSISQSGDGNIASIEQAYRPRQEELR